MRQTPNFNKSPCLALSASGNRNRADGKTALHTKFRVQGSFSFSLCHTANKRQVITFCVAP